MFWEVYVLICLKCAYHFDGLYLSNKRTVLVSLIYYIYLKLSTSLNLFIWNRNWKFLCFATLLLQATSLDVHDGIADCDIMRFWFSFQVIAGYDDGFDHRQPRDLEIPCYTKEVMSSVCVVTIKFIFFSIQDTYNGQFA